MASRNVTGILVAAALAALAIPLAPQPTRIPLLFASSWLIAQILVLRYTWKHPLHGRAINAAVAAIAVLTLAGSYAAFAQALELGISDAQAPIEQRNQWAININAHWERLIVDVGQPGIAARIRASHAAGRNVILTVGGIGTRTRRPSFTRALRYIHTLPKAEKYTIDNEPYGDGTSACRYLRGWRMARRVLGAKLLFLDGDPFYPAEYIAKMTKCKRQRLPKSVGLAIHPYTWHDPLTPAGKLGEIGNLGHLCRVLRAMGMNVTLWITEFGFAAHRSTEDGFMATTGSLPAMSDAQAARMWPRALKQARHVDAKVLVLYTAQGPSWDTRPGVQAWAAIRSAA